MLSTQRQGATTGASSSFALTRDTSSGLWNGLLSVHTAGSYQIMASSTDGAGNHTVRRIINLLVSPSGRVTSRSSGQPLTAKLTLYYLEPATHTWQVWSAAPYGETNPQTTTANGTYSLMVPRGEYYLRVSAPHQRKFTSTIFKVSQPQAITAAITLESTPHLGPLYLPDVSWGAQALPAPTSTAASSSQSLVGALLPDFALPTSTGSTQRGIDLSGKPTVITLLSTWAPDSQSQIPALAAAQTNHDINVVPIFSQQDPALVTIYLATGGYNLVATIDPDGQLVGPLQVAAVPEHLFVDRTGRIKKVMVGVLSEQDLLSQLGGLQ